MRDGHERSGPRRVEALAAAFLVGAGFGAATSVANAVSHEFADLESVAYTNSGWSFPEIVSVLMDSGWAWAGLAVFAGWLATRAHHARPSASARGAAAGTPALLAAVAAYAFADTVRDGGSLSSFYLNESPVWWVAGVLFGAPLGAVGACAHRPGTLGVLARLTVPIGAAVQMILLPPGRNAVITSIGQVIVGVAAAAGIALVLIRARSRPRPVN
jgi:hypothetical protein